MTAHPRRLLTTVATAAAGAIAALLCISVVVQVVGFPTRVGVLVTLDNVVLPISCLLATLTSWQASRRTTGRMARGWRLLSLAGVVFVTAQVAWLGYGGSLISGEMPADPNARPLPLGQNLVVASATLVMMAGVILLAGDRPWPTPRSVLDCTIFAITLLAMALLMVACVPPPAERAGVTVFTVIYLVSDGVLATMACRAARRAGPTRVSLYLIAVTMLGFAALCLMGTYLPPRPASQPGWQAAVVMAASFVALTFAALLAGPDEVLERAQRDSSVVSHGALAAGIATIVVTWQLGLPLPNPVLALVFLGVLLTLVRQYLTQRENWTLLAEVRTSRDDLYRQAFHDPLTGQASRSLFTRRLAMALDAGRQDGTAVAMLIGDIDAFKSVNDGLGHGIGDRVLAQVAWRVRGRLPVGATLARLGADEFAVLIEGLDPDAAASQSAAGADELTAALTEPFQVDGHQVSIGMSFGVVVIQPDDEPVGVDEVLSRADIALHTSKRSHRRSPVLYSAGLSLPESQDWQLRPAVEQALRDGRILAYYQPVVELATGRVHAVEALARWHRGEPDEPNRADLSGGPGDRHPDPGVGDLGVARVELPDVFLPVVTRAGLLPQLTDHMLRLATEQVALWRDEGQGDAVRVSVNISPTQLVDPAFPDRVRAALDAAELAPGVLALEITEEALLDDQVAAERVVRTLHDLGVQLWLDDFGSGYSSLALLHQLPLHAVKLDKGLVRTVDTDEGLRRLAGGLVTLAGDLGLVVVAEGIQRQAQMQVLRDVGCPLGQGHLFSPPAPAEACDQLLGRSRASTPTPNGVVQLPVPRRHVV